MPVDHWIDVHCHFFPPMPDEGRQAIVDILNQNCWCLSHLDQWTPEATLRMMDEVGIQMQMLSFMGSSAETLQKANDYGAELVRRHPDRFGLLYALPTNDPEACLREIPYALDELGADGFAVQHIFSGATISDPALDPVWEELNRREAVVFAHPNAFGSAWGRPGALIEVAFQTASVITDLIYRGLFRRTPDVKFIFTHSGGAFPALSGRLLLLGTQPWVPNPNNITRDDMRDTFQRIFLDTAMTMPTGLNAALAMTSPDKILYGSDGGVPCSTDESLSLNLDALVNFDGLSTDQINAIGRNALTLFPRAKARIEAGLGAPHDIADPATLPA